MKLSIFLQKLPL